MRTSGLRLDQAPPLDIPLRFFVTAPLFGAGAAVYLLAAGAPLLHSPWIPGTMALAHLVTLGWLSMVMLGALYQVVPVLVGSLMPVIGVARYVHAGLALGTVLLVAGLAGSQRTVLLAALVVLAIAFTAVLPQLVVALLQAEGRGPSVASVGIAVGSLLAAVVLGLLFVGQHALGWLALPRPGMTGTHVALALGGWIGALVTGVGYAVIPMFYLGGAFPRRVTDVVRWALLAALVLFPAVLLASGAGPWLLVPLAAGAVAWGSFAWAVRNLLRQRRRKVVDATLRFWQTGLTAGGLALAALAVFALTGGTRWLLAFGVLYLVGFAGGVINGMLYKIVPFLVWLHRFSMRSAKEEVPLLRDIILPAHMQRQWWLFVAALLLLTAAALYPADVLVRTGAAVLLAAELYLLWLLARAAAQDPDAAIRDVARRKAARTAQRSADAASS